MARKPPIGRRFKKGQSGNPKGAALHNPELKRLRKMSRDEIAEIGTLILDGNLDQLRAIEHDEKASVLKAWFASVAVKAVKRGDAMALSVVLEQIAGKPKAELNVNATGFAELIAKAAEEAASGADDGSQPD